MGNTTSYPPEEEQDEEYDNQKEQIEVLIKPTQQTTLYIEPRGLQWENHEYYEREEDETDIRLIRRSIHWLLADDGFDKVAAITDIEIRGPVKNQEWYQGVVESMFLCVVGTTVVVYFYDLPQSSPMSSHP